MDSSVNVGVFTEDGSLTHWNILADGVSGRVKGDGSKVYYLKDHLGSTRAVIDEAGEIQESHDYYPFGLEMPGRGTVSDPPFTKELFTGKERDSETGLDYFGARYYDASIGRFLSVDPVEHFSFSPFAYATNNPINFIDPTGMDTTQTKNNNKKKEEATTGVLDFPITTPTINVGVLRLLGVLGILLSMSGDTRQDDSDEASDSDSSNNDETDAESGESAAEKVPDLTDKSRSDAEQILRDHGFKQPEKPTTDGGYDKWYHPDGSRVQIRPNGEVIRTGPKVKPSGGGKKYRPRIDQSGNKGAPHKTGEKLKN